MQKLNNESLPQTVKKLQRKNLQKFTAVRETGVSWHHEVPIEGPTPRTSQHYIVSTGLRGPSIGPPLSRETPLSPETLKMHNCYNV